MKRFAYLEPATLQEAVALLSKHNGQAQVLAGGTDLFVEMKEHLRHPEHVINIKKIPGLDQFTYDEALGLRFGSLVTVRELETSPIIQKHYQGLGEAFRVFASIQVRNRATVAGNICRASPSNESSPALIADGATVQMCGPDGEREVPVESFFTGPGKTVLAPNEIVTGFAVPAPAPGTGKAYIKHGRRKAMELAQVGVAVSLTAEGGTCRQVRVALGAVAPTPIRAKDAEALLTGQPITDECITEAAEATAAVAKPISDVRGSADYRREMVRVLTARAVRTAWERTTQI